MSNVPRERGITEKARKGKKRVRVGQRVALDPVVSLTQPMRFDRFAEPLDESSSPQAVASAANSSIWVSWPFFPLSQEQHKWSLASQSPLVVPSGHSYIGRVLIAKNLKFNNFLKIIFLAKFIFIDVGVEQVQVEPPSHFNDYNNLLESVGKVLPCVRHHPEEDMARLV